MRRAAFVRRRRDASALILASALGAGGVVFPGCGDRPPSGMPVTTTRPPSTATTTSTSLSSAGAPPSTLAAPTSAEEARRVLEQHGIDPDRLSEELAEQMRHRFDPVPPR